MCRSGPQRRRSDGGLCCRRSNLCWEGERGEMQAPSCRRAAKGGTAKGATGKQIETSQEWICNACSVANRRSRQACYKCGDPRGNATRWVELAHRRGVWSGTGWVSANTMDVWQGGSWEIPEGVPRIIARERLLTRPGQANQQAAQLQQRTSAGRSGSRPSSNSQKKGRARSQNRGNQRGAQSSASGARGSAEPALAGETITIDVSQQVASLTEGIHRLSPCTLR